jgi:hypothetical protein
MKPLVSGNAEKISLDDLLPLKSQTVRFLPLEIELLKKRIKDGGHSGEFLFHAFISSYRTHTPFQHSLGEIMKLDMEAIRLFHQILGIRFIKDWSDDVLYNLEKEIIKLNEEAS